MLLNASGSPTWTPPLTRRFLCLHRGKLRLRVGEPLQEGGLHEERQPQLVCEREGLGEPEEHAGQGRRRRPGGEGLRPAQAGDGDAQRCEAAQGRAHPAQQEDGALLRAGAHRHHGGHQARERHGQEDLHAGREAGTSDLEAAGGRSYVPPKIPMYRVLVSLFFRFTEPSKVFFYCTELSKVFF